MKKIILILFILTTSITLAQSRIIGTAKTKGFLSKRRIEVFAMPDPDIKGIVIFYTRLVKPGVLYNSYGSDSSIAVRQVGKISGVPTTKANIASKASGWMFKEMIIDRFYDKTANSLVYLIYTKNLSGKNNSHSISVISLNKAEYQAEQ